MSRQLHEDGCVCTGGQSYWRQRYDEENRRAVRAEEDLEERLRNSREKAGAWESMYLKEKELGERAEAFGISISISHEDLDCVHSDNAGKLKSVVRHANRFLGLLADLKTAGLQEAIDDVLAPKDANTDCVGTDARPVATEPGEWWLISNDDVGVVRNLITTSLDRVVPANAPIVHGLLKQALHALDTGLHKTDEVPDDFKVSVQSMDQCRHRFKYKGGILWCLREEGHEAGLRGFEGHEFDLPTSIDLPFTFQTYTDDES